MKIHGKWRFIYYYFVYLIVLLIFIKVINIKSLSSLKALIFSKIKSVRLFITILSVSSIPPFCIFFPKLNACIEVVGSVSVTEAGECDVPLIEIYRGGLIFRLWASTSLPDVVQTSLSRIGVHGELDNGRAGNWNGGGKDGVMLAAMMKATDRRMDARWTWTKGLSTSSSDL